MVLTSAGFVMAEDTTGTTPAYDAQAYEVASGLMESLLGASVFGSDPAAQVSRAQFVSGVTKIFGVPAISADQLYSDVGSDHAFFGEISSAYNAGWISYAEKFNPDAVIKLSEAVKIMLCAADYKVMADAKGGYPAGYLTVAQSIDLLDNVQSAEAGALTVADATIMFENLMMADVFEIESYGEKMDYRKGGEIYLEKLYEAYSVEGVLTSTIYSSMVMDAPFIKDNDEVTIDGIAYKCSKIDENLLGKKVVAYVSKDGTKKTLYCAIPEDNTEFTVIAADFGGISGNDFTYYDENGRGKTKRLDSAYKVIYNGRRVSKIEPYMLEDIGATVRILENSGDSAFDVVFIDGYIYGMITGVDFVNGYVGIETPGSMIDLNDEDEYVCYIESSEGKEIELFELKRGTVLAIKASADERIYQMKVCENTASGAITAVLPEEGIVTIDKKDYNASKAFIERYISGGLIDVGDNVSITIGVHGELAYLAASIADMRYGYLLDVKYDNKGFDSSVMVKLYGGGSDFDIYELEEKLTIDGGTTKTKREDVVSGLVANSMSVIKYSLNEDGKINAIDFLTDDVTGFGELKNSMNSLTKFYDNAAGQLRYRSGCYGFNSKAILTNASIFFVPAQESDRDDIEKFSVGSYTTLQSDSMYSCDIYDIDEYGMAAFVVIYSEAASDPTAYTYGSYVVESVTKAINDSIEGYNIYCWANKTYHTLFLPGDVEVDKANGRKNDVLTSGDIVRFRVQNNIIKNVYVDYKFEDGKPVFVGSTGSTNSNVTAENRLAYIEGKVYSANGSSIVISQTADEDGIYDFSFENLKPYKTAGTIVCFDTETGKVRPVSVDNIRTYRGYKDNADMVIMRQNYTSPNCIIVIR